MQPFWVRGLQGAQSSSTNPLWLTLISPCGVLTAMRYDVEGLQTPAIRGLLAIYMISRRDTDLPRQRVVGVCVGNYSTLCYSISAQSSPHTYETHDSPRRYRKWDV